MSEYSSRVRRMCTLLMCLMLLLFATQTKTALYKGSSPTVRTLAASKLWTNSQSHKAPCPDAPQESFLAIVLLALVSTFRPVAIKERCLEFAGSLHSFLDLDGISHFHRPPPVVL